MKLNAPIKYVLFLLLGFFSMSSVFSQTTKEENKVKEEFVASLTNAQKTEFLNLDKEIIAKSKLVKNPEGTFSIKDKDSNINRSVVSTNLLNTDTVSNTKDKSLLDKTTKFMIKLNSSQDQKFCEYLNSIGCACINILR